MKRNEMSFKPNVHRFLNTKRCDDYNPNDAVHFVTSILNEKAKRTM